jgi:6-phospho-beta-glucosidase
VYTPEFVLSLVSHNVNIKEITLLGREGPKLPLVADFCQRLVDKSGFPSKVLATTDVTEAVDGARYILNHTRVGGMPARLRDEKLPPQLGMVGDESLGAGGFANAMRTLPVLMDLVRQIEEVNEEAIFINLSNPMGILMQALNQCSKLTAIGVCDLPARYIRKMANMMQLNASELEVAFIGLDRMGWIQDVKHAKHSIMDKVLERVEGNGGDDLDTRVIELFRMIPTRALSMYFHQDQVLKKQRTMSRHRAEVLFEAERQILALYEDKSLSEIPELTRQRNAIWYEETIVPLIMALESKSPVDVILNVRNGESIRDLPSDASVEVPVQVSQDGIVPRKVGSCPRFLRGLFTAVKDADYLAVKAATHKSLEYAMQSLCINPFVPSLETAERFLEKLIKEENIELH